MLSIKKLITARYSAPGAVQSQAPAAPINSCYQTPSGHDMRSPQLMSPTQASVPGAVSQAAGGGLTPPIVNNTALQRSISNSTLIFNEFFSFIFLSTSCGFTLVFKEIRIIWSFSGASLLILNILKYLPIAY